MKPIKTDDQNAVLKLDGGTEENDLPCKVEDGWTISTWELDDEERVIAAERKLLGVFLWWPNLIGVRLHVQDHADEAGSDATMAYSCPQRTEEGDEVYSLSKGLNEDELASIADGAPVILQVDMHPTCPVRVTVDF